MVLSRLLAPVLFLAFPAGAEVAPGHSTWPVARPPGGDPEARMGDLRRHAESLRRRAGGATSGEALEVLRGALDDPDRSARVLAARALAREGDRAALERALSWLHSGTFDHMTAGLEALRLATAWPPDAAPAVLRLLSREESAIKLAAFALLEERNVTVPVPLAAAVADDESVEVRLGAVGALARARDVASVAVLAVKLEDPEALVRAEAARALGALGDRRTVPALARLCGGDNRESEPAALQALGEIGGDEAVKTLERHLGSDPDGGTARQALLALGMTGERAATAAIVRHLVGPQAQLVGLDAHETALALAGPEAAAPLLAILTSMAEAASGFDPRVVEVVVRALSRLRETRAIPAMRRLARAAGPVAPTAVVALGQVAAAAATDSATTDLSLLALEDPSQAIRSLALQALAAIPGVAPAAVLPEAFDDANAGVRRAATSLAHAHPDPAFAPGLAARLSDADGEVRVRALKALGAAPAPAALDDLLAFQPVDTTRERVALADALAATLGAAPSGWGKVTAALRAKGPALRAAAVVALARAAGCTQAARGLTSADLAWLLPALDAGGTGSLAAARLLAGNENLATDLGGPLSSRATRLEPPVQAALAGALAFSIEGRARLRDWIAAEDQPAEVSIAAARVISVQGRPEARAILAACARDPRPVVAQTCAALARNPEPRASRSLSLRRPDGTPAAGIWVRFGDAESRRWLRTDLEGTACLPASREALELDVPSGTLTPLRAQAHTGRRARVD